MELDIRALSCPPPDHPHSIHARFGEEGGRIGRSSACTLPLPSPDRCISREHVEIRYRDGCFFAKVVSKVGWIAVNDKALQPGGTIELVDGDKIQIGDYVLAARVCESATLSPERHDSRVHQSPASALRQGDQMDTNPDWPRPLLRGVASASEYSAQDPVAPAHCADSAALKKAVAGFASALGLKAEELDETRPFETLQVAGRLLRLAIDGLFQVVAPSEQARLVLPSGELTMIASGANNPLRHAETTSDVLRHLIDLRQRGNRMFMQPEQAIQDAIAEVRLREAATLAGARAALEIALRKQGRNTSSVEREGSAAEDLLRAAIAQAYAELDQLLRPGD